MENKEALKEKLNNIKELITCYEMDYDIMPFDIKQKWYLLCEERDNLERELQNDR